MAFRRVFAWLTAAALLFTLVLAPARARAATWTPPPLKGHVVDTSGALTPAEARALDLKLDRARQETGFAVVVFLLPHLPEGLTIEDVGYQAGNGWGVGSSKGDDGVLLINSVAERKLRIETGKGVGGALTDVESSHINREIVGPLLKENRTYDAMNAGTDAILKALVENTPGGKSSAGQGPQRSTQKTKGKSAVENASAKDLGQMAIWIVIAVAVIALAIYSPTFRSILFYLLFFGRGGGGGGSGSGSGGGGGGYGGGGGSFGGGGSSDDY